MNKVVVLYHASCMDGLGAKYAAWRKFGDDAKYIPVQYGQQPPEIQEILPFFELRQNEVFNFDIKGDGSYFPTCVKITDAGYVNTSEGFLHATKVNHIAPATQVKTLPDVYILDFSYKKEILDSLAGKSHEMVILDHHKTAKEDLEGYPGAHFDMTKSGAVLAWEYFFPDEEVPLILKHIQDRDLWTWKLQGTADVIAGLSLLKGDMDLWHDLMHDSWAFDRVKEKGEAIIDYQNMQVTEKLRNVKILPYKGYKAGVLNTTHLVSEIGNAICKDAQLGVDFSLSYFFDNQGTPILSFRSIGDMDVSALAKELGGGGHANAAGAKVTLQFIQDLYQEKL